MSAYRRALAEGRFKEMIKGLLKKSMRDHERFLRILIRSRECWTGMTVDIAAKMEYAFLLSKSIRPGNHHSSFSTSSLPPTPPPTSPPLMGGGDIPVMFTRYHPLLVESHFSIPICQFMLVDFANPILA